MKKYIRQILLIGAAALLLSLTFISCNKSSDLGMEILPGTDLINVKNVVVKDSIVAYANTETGIVTSKSDYNLLGSFSDPEFGNTTANFATHFRILSYPDYGTNPTVDSVFLYLYYKGVYGDTLTPQHIRIYELESPLDADATYNQDVDLKSMASTQMIGELTFNPTVKTDTTYGTVIIQRLQIPIDNSLGQKLLSADSLDKVSNDAFLSYFKGIYVETEKINSTGGSLITLTSAIGYINDVDASADSTGNPFYDLQIYYKNDESLNKEDPDTTDTGLLTTGFYITEYSARVNSLTHDYTGTPFQNDIDQQVKQEDKIYIQPTGGIKSNILIGGLSGWRDSTNIAINKAELVFQIDTIASDIENYPPPASLLLTYVDTSGNEYFPIDYFFSPAFYDGSLDTSDYTYHFNITQHIQQVIDVVDPEDDNYVGNQGFYLTTGQKSDDAKRVILEGTKRNGGVKFIITYSEYLK